MINSAIYFISVGLKIRNPPIFLKNSYIKTSLNEIITSIYNKFAVDKINKNFIFQGLTVVNIEEAHIHILCRNASNDESLNCGKE